MKAEEFLNNIRPKYSTIKCSDVCGNLVDFPLSDLLEAYAKQYAEQVAKEAFEAGFDEGYIIGEQFADDDHFDTRQQVSAKESAYSLWKERSEK